MNAAPLVCLLLVVGAEDRLAPLKTSARAFVEALFKKDYESASKDFDDVVRKAAPQEKLQDIIKAITNQVGPLEKILSLRTESVGKADFVFVTCQFKKNKLDVKVVYDRKGKISGFFFVPTKSAQKIDPPPYARPERYEELAMKVGRGDTALPATLTMPKGNALVPAVVLLQGSGPQDRDETLGANKPLRDLAWGLASEGIAVLRFDKRTYHPDKLGKINGDRITLKEEVIDDALAALFVLRTQGRIDRKRIFVLGHSLGGMCVPKILSLDHDVAGGILLAANARPLEDVILDQVNYLTSLAGKLSDEDQKKVEQIKKQVARVKDLKLAPDTPKSELPLGVPAPYWLALRTYEQTAVAATLKQRLLILQGERDYQVTMTDFALWKKALANHKEATFKSYPALNHLFMPGQGKSTPAEYEKADHIDKSVLDDLAAWIKKR